MKSLFFRLFFRERGVPHFFLVVLFFLCCAAEGHAEYTFYAGTAGELSAALTQAESNGQDDVIKIKRGEYNGNFAFDSGEGHSIALEGGYDPTFTERAVNPENTILDGGQNGRVLLLQNSDGGSITVDGLTIRNGSGTGGAGVWAWSYKDDSGDIGDITLTNNIVTGNTTGTGQVNRGGGVYIYSSANDGTSANILLSGNIITWNTADYDGGGVYASTRSYPSGNSGTIVISNNIIAKNTATAYDGGGMNINTFVDDTTYTCGNVYLSNNTVTGNNAGRSGGGVYLSARNGTVRVYNNIVWGNTAGNIGDDIVLWTQGSDPSSSWNGYYNDYTDMAGLAWTNSGYNIDVDPLFVNGSAGNYHIRGNSPCINAGIYAKKTVIIGSTTFYYDYSFIPDNDFEGDSRNSEWVQETGSDYYKYCDMGADEYTSPVLPGLPLLLLNQ